MSDDRPNIILITTDEQRGDCLGINGHDTLRTPFLDSLAAGGVNFPRAHTSCPVCIPARRTMLSGLHTSTHGMNTNREAQSFDPPCTLPGLLRDAGWQTQLVGKFHVAEPGRRLGFDNIIQSETPNDRRHTPHQRRNDYADWYERQPGAGPHTLFNGIMSNDRTARPWTQDEQLHQTNWVTNTAADFLGRYRDPSCPFFLHLSYWAPHQPMLPPQCYWDRYADHDWNPVMGDWVPERAWQPGLPLAASRGPFRSDEMHDCRRGYMGLINHIDDQLNYLFDRWSCATLKPDRPTWIIFTSDHGEMNGDHQLFRKNTPYEGSHRIPFFISGIRGATVAQPGTSQELACLEDLMPTVLDLAGLAIPDHLRDCDGQSLLPCLRGEQGRREHMHSDNIWSGRHWRSVIDRDGMKYIRWTSTGEEQVFNINDDPNDLHDISADADLDRLRQLVDAHRDAGATADSDGDAPLRPCAGAAPSAIWG